MLQHSCMEIEFKKNRGDLRIWELQRREMCLEAGELQVE